MTSVVNDESNWILAQKIRMATGSLSFGASATVAVMILVVSKGRIATPYRRIIFGLSISDVLQSTALVMGNFASPADTPNALWSSGNVHTCNTIGLILSLGGLMVPMYTFALCFYFLCRVKHRMTPADFASKVEWKLHTFFILWNGIGSTYMLLTKSFNAGRYGTVCTARGYPLYCDHDPEIYGECTRGANARKMSMFATFIPAVLCFVGMFICLGKTISYVYVQEKQMRFERKQQQERAVAAQTNNEEDRKAGSSRDHDDHNNRASSSDMISRFKQALLCFCRPSSSTTTTSSTVGGMRNSDIESQSHQPQISLPASSTAQIQMRWRRRSFILETLIQSSLYIVSCVVTYFFVYLFMFTELVDIVPGPWLSIVSSTFYPLGGVFNILIYTRPKVLILRERSPDSLWIVLFVRIILAGAEVPDETPDNAPVRGDGLVPSRSKTSTKFPSPQEGIVDRNAVLAIATSSSRDVGNITISSRCPEGNDGDENRTNGGRRRGSVVRDFFNREKNAPILAMSSVGNSQWSVGLMDVASSPECDLEEEKEERYQMYANVYECMKTHK